MHSPERIWSTPRLILVIFTIGLMIFTYNGTAEITIFKDLALVIFGYFFGSRGSEPTAPPPTTGKTDTTTITASTTTDLSLKPTDE